MRSILITLCLLIAGCRAHEVEPEARVTTPGTSRVFALRFAQAQEIADTIDDLVQSARRAAEHEDDEERQGVGPRLPGWMRGLSAVRTIADPRTNSVIVTVQPDHPQDLDRVAELIRRLDVHIDVGEPH